ncbi:MAG: hypothetical protein COT74_07685 [Bdellovibrionales bacterium CG10_big_fil_rev_8_21_14_0_10_45_34]|nr:MAG: hypothetical protein COT74_07685 [Bdellovibrionales bacterium CG10_big_fil_rev_8_21_14_0_10_45_34]
MKTSKNIKSAPAPLSELLSSLKGFGLAESSHVRILLVEGAPGLASRYKSFLSEKVLGRARVETVSTSNIDWDLVSVFDVVIWCLGSRKLNDESWARVVSHPFSCHLFLYTSGSFGDLPKPQGLRKLHNARYSVLPYLCSKSRFEKTVRRLSESVYLLRQLFVLNQEKRFLNDLLDFIANADIEQVLPLIFDYLAREYKATRVVWMGRDCLQRLEKSDRHGWTEQRKSIRVPSTGGLYSWGALPDEEFHALFDRAQQIQSSGTLDLDLNTNLRVIDSARQKYEGEWLVLRVSTEGEELGLIFINQPEKHQLIHFLGLEKPLMRSFALAMCVLRSASVDRTLSYTDDLTELFNQRFLEKVLDTEISRAGREGGKFSVLFVDVDRLKQINDENGHRVGSQILARVGNLFKRNIRSTDYAFRYGGDEYLLILVGAGSTDAQMVAERIRQQVAEMTFEFKGNLLSVTLSIGVASYPDHALTKEQIIEMADQAMYVGKRKSRNAVFVAS